jgi:FtsP/CotA-like multicopper oxidase with cupredoxin domain
MSELCCKIFTTGTSMMINKESKMKTLKFLAAALLAGSLLAACAPQVVTPVDNEYILTTALRDGNFVYLGVNSSIAGLPNPDLYAKPGETVSITLINGGEGQHDITIPALDIKSTGITKKGETTSITFRVPKDNVLLEYMDTTHENLGMRGVLQVGSVTATGTPLPGTEPSQPTAGSIVK